MGSSVGEKYSAVFALRNTGKDDAKLRLQAIQVLGQAMRDDSVLIAHESGYAIGQMQDERACDLLIEVLNDKSLDSVVRHEAGEALGAISQAHKVSEKVVEALTTNSKDEISEVSETCILALESIKNLRTPQDDKECEFLSIDPAPAGGITDLKTLKDMLLNSEIGIFERYKAIMDLRNLKSDESAAVLADALSMKSLKFMTPLVMHEIAFVLGEMELPVATEALCKAVADTDLHPMIRHEAAESLGSINTDECRNFLNKHKDDKSQIVRDSIMIALGSNEYL